MNVQFKKGALELCVLILISKKDQYGYELAQSISSKIEVAEGTLYPLLRRLTKEEYVSTYLAESTEGPPRKYYYLTEKGAAYMRVLIDEWKQFSNAVNEFIVEGLENEESNVSWKIGFSSPASTGE
ncbi:PadR family transcriptional regulator [Fictibacillus aquaticus]|uniref:PadR family transcriptional regulator n=1 Tax=Fictibacillus aquaticus TaxID=2021314 RepID=A0A235F5Z9_9BACL|nr:PadR family transcriptional regulator [Fictibacillus aquaticus]OYD56669.1 PadR family transcriptional regulator [Fictibacillus aquaticus]